MLRGMIQEGWNNGYRKEKQNCGSEVNERTKEKGFVRQVKG